MYIYEEHKPWLFSDEGVRALISTRDMLLAKLKISGAIRFEEAMRENRISDSWNQLAVIDYLVEIGDLIEIVRPGTAAQYRVFIRSGKDAFIK